jgi:GH25 family lysozyme M1 (1,4-beta-N-acetylmuramidase)
MSDIFPDISFWQKNTNFDIMQTKTDYVIIRSGQRNWIDSQFEYNRTNCDRVGLKWGIYWFYDDRSSPAAQADLLYSLFSKGQSRPLEIWCDWEAEYSGVFKGITNVVAFMQSVEQLMGMEVGMYTGYYWFMEHTNAITNFSQLNYLKSKKLWLAAYTSDNSNTGVSFVRIPRPWKAMDIWQYGTPAIGYDYGVNTMEIDMDERLTASPVPPTKLSYRTIVKSGFTFVERK